MTPAQLDEHRALVEKCLWLFELLVDEGPPRTCGELVSSTGIARKIVEDCLYVLIQRGSIVVNSRSQLLPERMRQWKEIV